MWIIKSYCSSLFARLINHVQSGEIKSFHSNCSITGKPRHIRRHGALPQLPFSGLLDMEPKDIECSGRVLPRLAGWPWELSRRFSVSRRLRYDGRYRMLRDMLASVLLRCRGRTAGPRELH